jgi:hypothetical protein
MAAATAFGARVETVEADLATQEGVEALQARLPGRPVAVLLASLMFLATMTGCGPPAPDAPAVSSAPDSSATITSSESAQATAASSDSAESPKVTASSAAAAAPECKEIEQTKPGSCQSHGVPANSQ